MRGRGRAGFGRGLQAGAGAGLQTDCEIWLEEHIDEQALVLNEDIVDRDDILKGSASQGHGSLAVSLLQALV